MSSTTISGRVAARRPGPRRGGRVGARAGIGRRHLRVDLGDRVDGLEHGRADRRAPAGGEAVEAAQQGVALGGRRHGELREPGEHDQPDPGVVVLVLHELADRGLGGREPVRVDVGGAHRARHVEREDDRRVGDRHVHAHLGPGRGHAEQPERGEHQRERQVPLPRRPPRVPPPGSARRWSAAPPACAAAGCCQTYAATSSGNTSRERRANGHWTPIATPPARTTGTTARRPRAAAARPRPRRGR